MNPRFFSQLKLQFKVHSGVNFQILILTAFSTSIPNIFVFDYKFYKFSTRRIFRIEIFRNARNFESTIFHNYNLIKFINLDRVFRIDSEYLSIQKFSNSCPTSPSIQFFTNIDHSSIINIYLSFVFSQIRINIYTYPV